VFPRFFFPPSWPTSYPFLLGLFFQRFFSPRWFRFRSGLVVFLPGSGEGFLVLHRSRHRVTSFSPVFFWLFFFFPSERVDVPPGPGFRSGKRALHLDLPCVCVFLELTLFPVLSPFGVCPSITDAEFGLDCQLRFCTERHVRLLHSDAVGSRPFFLGGERRPCRGQDLFELQGRLCFTAPVPSSLPLLSFTVEACSYVSLCTNGVSHGVSFAFSLTSGNVPL